MNKIVQIATAKHRKQIFAGEFNYSGDEKKVAYIFGADMMIPKKLFDNLGGFDPDFFMYSEEQELSWRVTAKGYNIVNIPQAQIIHLEGATVKKGSECSEKQFRMRMNGTLTYFQKRFGINGVNEFYKYRTKRYRRLIQIAKWRGRDLSDFTPVLQLQCLQEVFQNFIKCD